MIGLSDIVYKFFECVARHSGSNEFCYFGGFAKAEPGEAGVPVNLYMRSTKGDVTLFPHIITDEEVLAQFRAMEIGAPLYLVDVDMNGGRYGDIRAIETIKAGRAIRIQGVNAEKTDPLALTPVIL